MHSIRNRIAFITGASSGIGEACARMFAAAGVHLILAARRKDKLEKLSEELKQEHNIEVHQLTIDVRNLHDIEDSLALLPEALKEIDILINNAGLSLTLDPIHEGKIEDWSAMIDTNIKGLLFVTKLILPRMLKRNQGHIINIGSVSAHHTYAGGTVYCATKHAVLSITKGLKQELHGTPLRVTCVDPGMVETEFSIVRFKGNRSLAKEVYKDLTPLTAADIADAVFYAATRPPHVNIADIILLPTEQKGIG